MHDAAPTLLAQPSLNLLSGDQNNQESQMKMSTTVLLCGALLAPALGHAQQLITEAESAAEQAHLSQGILMAKAIPPPGAPQIEVMEPDMKQTLKAPFAVRVHFVTDGKATITPASLKVYYGVFGIDITDR